MTTPTKAWMKDMWQEAQDRKAQYVRDINNIERKFLQHHKLHKSDVRFLWMDELIIGMEAVVGEKKIVYYEEDITGKKVGR